jgi:molecular chaperone GrpE
MAEKSRKIRIHSDDDAHDVSFEASDAVPVVTDDLDDENSGRQPIDLDAPIDLGDAVSGLDRRTQTESTPVGADAEFDDAPAPKVSSKELESLKAQAAQANDEKLRALADLQNFRRRGEEERTRIIRDANERLIRELLPVLDDFDLAVGAAKQTQSYEQLIGGVEAILRKFNETLAKQGVSAIEAVGEKFDPDLHEAVMLDEDTDLPDETVTSELRRGYLLNKRVIRPSLVKVAKGG